ncbi:hypothetical protein Tco_0108893, partial [Tanacetum coccineum]
METRKSFDFWLRLDRVVLLEVALKSYRTLYGYTKITRKPSKTGKHGHENGRVNKSRKQSQEKVKLQSKGSQTQSNPWKLKGENGNSSGPLHDGKVRLVISKLSLSSLKLIATSSTEEAQRGVGFALNSLTQQAQ